MRNEIKIPQVINSSIYTPNKIGKKERICINCNLPAKKCGLNCKRYKSELKKLKEQQNER